MANETLERNTQSTEYIVTPGESSAGAAALVIIALLLTAVIGYLIYIYSLHPSSTVIERSSTVQQPVVIPNSNPLPPTTPATPEPQPMTPNSESSPSSDGAEK